MTQNVPLVWDRDQFASGPAQMEITYYGTNADTGALEEFSCTGGECSTGCVPDTVRVRITGYEFRSFFGYLGLPPLACEKPVTIREHCSNTVIKTCFIFSRLDLFS